MNHATPQSLPTTFRCGNHPEREGVGICVQCRAVVCVECSTKVDRMNYCIRCLTAAAEPVPEVRELPDRSPMLAAPLLVAGFIGTAVVFAALGYLLALFRTWVPGGITPG